MKHLIRAVFLAGVMACAGAAASAKVTSEQRDAIESVATVAVATTDDHCPRMRRIQSAMREEYESVGINSKDERDSMLKEIDNDLDQDHTGYSLFVMLIRDYDARPSEFCAKVWKLYGPDGMHRRQMVEPK
ncbi:hypothetical protein [Bradyrhizobium sp. S3.7.6]